MLRFMTQDIFPVEDEDLFILCRQYHGCWWPGNARSQGISSNDIGLVVLECSGLSKKEPNKFRINLIS